MNTFNVDLNIEDCTYSAGCKNCNSTEVNITSTAQTITLQDCYILNVIAKNIILYKMKIVINWLTIIF